MRIVAGVDIDRSYHFDEIMEMNARGTLKPIALEGYVVRADADGMIAFIPWYESTLARQEAGRPVTVDISGDLEDLREEVEREHPLVRTSPQDKIARMIVRLMAEAKRTGTIAGLSDEQIRTITGEAWKAGETSITEDMVRKVVAHFLGVAEKQNREADSRRTTRQHPLA